MNRFRCIPMYNKEHLALLCFWSKNAFIGQMRPFSKKLARRQQLGDGIFKFIRDDDFKISNL